MIDLEVLAPGALKLTLPHKIQAADFQSIAAKVGPIIQEQGHIKLLIDATAFGGWEDATAFEAHATFVKELQQHVARLAVIVGHDWQRGFVALVSTFLHPEIRAFDKPELAEATKWVTS